MRSESATRWAKRSCSDQRHGERPRPDGDRGSRSEEVVL
jgi:hypothetical protein